MKLQDNAIQPLRLADHAIKDDPNSLTSMIWERFEENYAKKPDRLKGKPGDRTALDRTLREFGLTL